MQATHNAPNVSSSQGLATWRRPALLVATGAVMLSIGVFVYVADRGATQAWRLPRFGALTGLHAFGALGQWLPSFVHPLAFSLFTAAALPPSSVPRYGVCAAWAAMNVAFEIGQHAWVSARLAAALEGVPLARPLARYFTQGTFDRVDIAAALLGALAAGLVLRRLQRDLAHKHGQ
jgi:hypothetical protein